MSPVELHIEAACDLPYISPVPQKAFGNVVELRAPAIPVLQRIALKQHTGFSFRSDLFQEVDSLEFLEPLHEISSLAVHAVNLKDDAMIEQLTNLRYLSIVDDADNELDLSRLTKLEYLSIQRRRGCRGIESLVSLQGLGVYGWRSVDLSLLSGLKNLIHLCISDSHSNSIEALSELHSLRELELAHFPKVSSFFCLSALAELEKLSVQNCRKLSTVDWIGSLKRLRVLNLSDNGKLESLKPIKGLESLTSLFFSGATCIEDGRVGFINELQSVRRVTFQNRRHYDVKREELSAFEG